MLLAGAEDTGCDDGSVKDADDTAEEIDSAGCVVVWEEGAVKDERGADTAESLLAAQAEEDPCAA